MPNTEPPPLTDPEHWARRFDQLTNLVKENAKIARQSSIDAATNAAIKVATELARQQEEVKRDLQLERTADRRVAQDMHKKVDTLGDQMTEVLVSLNKISTAKLIQIGITALILAALVVIGIKALGG